MSFFVFYPPSGGGSSTNDSIGVNGAAAPGSSTQVAGQDPSGDLQPLQTDANGYLITTNDPASVQHVIVDSSALPAGASTSALQTAGNASLTSIDSKLTSPLAVTGPLTDTQLRAVAVPISAASLPLPTGAATSALQTTGNTSLSSIDGKVPSGLTVTSTRLLVDASGTTQPISGTVTVTQATGTNLHAVIDSGTITTVSAVTAITNALPTGTNSIGQVTANAGTNLNTSALNLETTQSAMSAKLPATLGQKTSAASLAVVIASDQSTVPVSLAANQSTNIAQISGNTASVGAGASGTGTLRIQNANIATATLANTSASTSSVSLLSAQTARAGATFFNDSSAIMYLKYGTTASTTSYTVLVGPNGYYELPGPTVYAGAIDAIWSAATGTVRITSW